MSTLEQQIINFISGIETHFTPLESTMSNDGTLPSVNVGPGALEFFNSNLFLIRLSTGVNYSPFTTESFTIPGKRCYAYFICHLAAQKMKKALNPDTRK